MNSEKKMNKYKRINTQILVGFLAAFILAGCASQRVSTKSSVMDYLYPNSSDTFVEPSMPYLKVPLRVGIAFVPESTDRGYAHNYWTGRTYSGGLTEAKKIDLLENIAGNFKELDFVGSIEVIPTAYLTPKGGFSNLSQIKTMYGVDVIALVSYDQVQFTDEGMLSLSYWTIVGAYVVSGEKNDTNTLMDTVVYDIDSKKLLFRAPGTSHVTGSSTPVNLSEELRADSIKGFENATEMMVSNLQSELKKFKQSIKDNPSQAQVAYREGYTGGAGSMQWPFLMMLTCLMVWRNRR